MVDFNEDPVAAPAYTYQDNYGGIGVAATPPVFHNTRTMCSPHVHYFECKHEPRCYCGRTGRIVELQVDEGL